MTLQEKFADANSCLRTPAKEWVAVDKMPKSARHGLSNNKYALYFTKSDTYLNVYGEGLFKASF